MKINENLKYLFNVAEKFGISIEYLDTDPVVILAKKSQKIISFYKGKLPLNSSGAAKISKDKDLTKTILEKSGIRTPKGIIVHDSLKLDEQIEKTNLRYPLVVKPNDEALGNGVTADIPSFTDVKKAVDSLASSGVTDIVVEEYFDGVDHRFLVLDGQVLAVAKRIKPRVVGNGKFTIKQLIEAYNIGRVHTVPFDGEVDRYLSEQGCDLASVLELNQEVILRGNSNYRTGGKSEDVTDSIGTKYKDVAQKAAKTIGLRLAGVDILIKENPDEGDDYIVTEINSVPGFDVHVSPDVGKSREEILEKVWSAIFK